MLFNTLADVTTIGGLLTELGTIISSCMTIFTGNWILMAVLVVSVGLPILASVFSLIRNR